MLPKVAWGRAVCAILLSFLDLVGLQCRETREESSTVCSAVQVLSGPSRN